MMSAQSLVSGYVEFDTMKILPSCQNSCPALRYCADSAQLNCEGDPDQVMTETQVSKYPTDGASASWGAAAPAGAMAGASVCQSWLSGSGAGAAAPGSGVSVPVWPDLTACFVSSIGTGCGPNSRACGATTHCDMRVFLF